MPTIQIRDIPEDAYEEVRLRAKASGQSIQAYMRQVVIDLTSRPTKAQAAARLERILATGGGAEVSNEEILKELHAGRR